MTGKKEDAWRPCIHRI